MIRSTYEYKHREWVSKVRQYSFLGVPIEEMDTEGLRAALAFMVQFNGDLGNKLHEERYGEVPTVRG